MCQINVRITEIIYTDFDIPVVLRSIRARTGGISFKIRHLLRVTANVDTMRKQFPAICVSSETIDSVAGV